MPRRSPRVESTPRSLLDVQHQRITASRAALERDSCRCSADGTEIQAVGEPLGGVDGQQGDALSGLNKARPSAA